MVDCGPAGATMLKRVSKRDVTPRVVVHDRALVRGAVLGGAKLISRCSEVYDVRKAVRMFSVTKRTVGDLT